MPNASSGRCSRSQADLAAVLQVPMSGKGAEESANRSLKLRMTNASLLVDRRHQPAVLRLDLKFLRISILVMMRVSTTTHAVAPTPLLPYEAFFRLWNGFREGFL